MKHRFPVFAIASALVLMLAMKTAGAQLRSLPQNAERGYVQHVQNMLISIDGKSILLEPSATIRDPNNFIIVPTALPSGGAWADYQLSPSGQVQRIWLLTPQEAATPRPRRP